MAHVYFGETFYLKIKILIICHSLVTCLPKCYGCPTGFFFFLSLEDGWQYPEVAKDWGI